MNLARKDVWHNRGRFALTTLGVGTLLMIVMGMGGIYRGLTEDATLLVQRVGADIWIVQRGTRGPFAEISRVPKTLVDRVAAVPGVDARPGVRLPHDSAAARGQTDAGGGPGAELANGPRPVVAARRRAGAGAKPLRDDRGSLAGPGLGERMRLGKDTYTVVGLTSGMSDPSGNGFMFFTAAGCPGRPVRPAGRGHAPGAAGPARSGRSRSNWASRSRRILERAAGPGAQAPCAAAEPDQRGHGQHRAGADAAAVIKHDQRLGGRVGVHARRRGPRCC